MTQDPDDRQEDDVAERDARVRGLQLPGLKRWRIFRGFTQKELAERVDMPLQYIARVEQGRRGCNPAVAQRVADTLDVSLQELGASSNVKEIALRYLHNAYLRLLLEREFGSAYLALDERELERHIQRLSAQELVEVIFRRRRELEFVEGLLAEGELHPQVRLFFEELVRSRPEEDLRVLAAARSRAHPEESHEERERLTQAMRELL